MPFEIHMFLRYCGSVDSNDLLRHTLLIRGRVGCQDFLSLGQHSYPSISKGNWFYDPCGSQNAQMLKCLI